jgi:hypothetical protein
MSYSYYTVKPFANKSTIFRFAHRLMNISNYEPLALCQLAHVLITANRDFARLKTVLISCSSSLCQLGI